MTDKRFRFAVAANPEPSGERWVATVRRAAELGYTTILMPDVLTMPAPFVSLAVAATAADIRVGTFVVAAPLRAPRATAWDAHTLSVLTDGRFDFGIGTGRPGMEADVRQLGRDWGTAQQRRDQVRETLDLLAELDGDRRTPVMLAAGGPKGLELAAERADIVSIAKGALTPRDEIRGLVRQLRELAGSRVDDIEIAMNLFAAGTSPLPPWTRNLAGADPDELERSDSWMMLRGTPAQMIDELQRRRDEFGTSYISVNGMYLEDLAPVVEKLAGQ